MPEDGAPAEEAALDADDFDFEFSAFFASLLLDDLDVLPVVLESAAIAAEAAAFFLLDAADAFFEGAALACAFFAEFSALELDAAALEEAVFDVFWGAAAFLACADLPAADFAGAAGDFLAVLDGLTSAAAAFAFVVLAAFGAAATVF